MYEVLLLVSGKVFEVLEQKCLHRHCNLWQKLLQSCQGRFLLAAEKCLEVLIVCISKIHNQSDTSHIRFFLPVESQP
jgi:hypothetical protein